MEQDNLIITKDNYKGYVQLYKTLVRGSTENFENEKGFIKKTVGVFCISFLLVMLGISCSAMSLLSNIFINIGAVTVISGEIVIYASYLKKCKQLEKKLRNKVKGKYPYIDSEINLGILGHSLEAAKIIVCEKKDGVSYQHLDVERYENYLKAEEIKEEYFQETKYDNYIINPKISKEELEKPKIKKLVR